MIFFFPLHCALANGWEGQRPQWWKQSIYPEAHLWLQLWDKNNQSVTVIKIKSVLAALVHRSSFVASKGHKWRQMWQFTTNSSISRMPVWINGKVLQFWHIHIQASPAGCLFSSAAHVKMSVLQMWWNRPSCFLIECVCRFLLWKIQHYKWIEGGCKMTIHLSVTTHKMK